MVDVIVSDDEKYPDFSLDNITALEGIALKRRAGIKSRQELQEGLGNDDPEVWQALIWLLRRRVALAAGGPEPRLSETDFPWGQTHMKFSDDELARIRAASEPDPKEPEEDGPNPTEPSPATS